ncbi:MAG: ABC transporter substrate-binding protein [Oscillospiraceae bacterium]|nr:ABC transporter substrate-binding protein [Oscillospiraceae bacterium]
MKKPTLFLAFFVGITLLFSACENPQINTGSDDLGGLIFEERAESEYAEQFAIDRYEGGYSLITTMLGARYLVVPEGKEPPKKLASEITVIRQPAENFYLAATAAMGLFAELGSGDAVKFSSIRADEWYVEYARDAMNSGKILYAGKYREPDYELLLSNGCTLSIQSTMIEHSPAVKEKLLELGIPVFIDYASYEPHPLGRGEWIKVYGEIVGKPEEAQRLFNEQSAKLKALENVESTGKTVAFFYINTAGQAVARRSGDYITKMIELGGGEYVFKDLGDSESAFSTVVMEMEKFYASAKDADIIIYNSTIGGEISSLDSILEKNSLLRDFKAVKEGNVWCTRENLYQETMKFGDMINDFHSVFSGTAEENTPTFLYRPESGEVHE